MPSLSGSWNRFDGAVVPVRVGISGQDKQALRAANRPIPQPVETTAMLDTGAEVTCVDPSVVTRLGLKFVGVTPVNAPAAGGLSGASWFDASVVLVHPSGRARDHLEVPNLPVIELALGAFGYDVVIGRDVLALCVFRFDGPALTFTLDY